MVKSKLLAEKNFEVFMEYTNPEIPVGSEQYNFLRSIWMAATLDTTLAIMNKNITIERMYLETEVWVEMNIIGMNIKDMKDAN